VQGLQGPTDRRKQGVKRGRHALDALDEFKIALLGGILSQVALSSPSPSPAASRAPRDAGLDGVLGEIELRVEVEIAKMAAR